jgi:hypothetical protein
MENRSYRKREVVFGFELSKQSRVSPLLFSDSIVFGRCRHTAEF